MEPSVGRRAADVVSISHSHCYGVQISLGELGMSEHIGEHLTPACSLFYLGMVQPSESCFQRPLCCPWKAGTHFCKSWCLSKPQMLRKTEERSSLIDSKDSQPAQGLTKVWHPLYYSVLFLREIKKKKPIFFKNISPCQPLFQNDVRHGRKDSTH